MLQRHLADVDLRMPFTSADLPVFGAGVRLRRRAPEILRLLAWSPAFPFGVSARHPATEVLRDDAVRAIALLVRPHAEPE